MDNTVVDPERENNQAVVVLTSLSGLVIFLENIVLLGFIFKLLTRYHTTKEQNDVIIQVFFVCVNDTLASFVLFWMGVVRVTGSGTAKFCAYTAFLTFTFQTMSQSNITCICAFRYNIAKNVRKLGPRRQSLFTVILVIVNVTVGVLCMSSFTATLSLNYIAEGTNIACEYVVVVTSQSTFVIDRICFAIGIIMTLVADVLCFMTIRRLKNKIHVVNPEEAMTTTIENTVSVGTLSPSVKTLQQNAILTVFLILLFFNLSLLPILIASVLWIVGVNLSPSVQRISYVCLFLNSLVNPIIIGKRIPEIRKYFQYIFQFIWNRVQCQSASTW